MELLFLEQHRSCRLGGIKEATERKGAQRIHLLPPSSLPTHGAQQAGKLSPLALCHTGMEGAWLFSSLTAHRNRLTTAWDSGKHTSEATQVLRKAGFD